MKRPALVCKGFTLIELLIVIAVIGVLATAVLSAINPVEQIMKAQDTSKKSDAAEYLNAVERHYATFEVNPWTVAMSGTSLSSVAGVNSISVLVNKGELKSQFQGRGNASSIFVTGAVDGLTTVCFEPFSKTFRAKAKFGNSAGGPGGSGATACPRTDLSAGCFICIPE